MTRQQLYFILPLLILLFPSATMAIDYKITAMAVDSLKEPESFATWRIYSVSDTSTTVAAALADSNGRIAHTLKQSGDYILSVSAVGKQTASVNFSVTATDPYADLGQIILHPSAEELQGITVTAQRPLVTKEIDRIGYDVKADSEAKTSTLQEILRKVPLVSVDAEGNITVNGSSDFKVYKNGRPNNSFTKNAKDIFAAIPASSIKKIEVITDPGAREDAEGVGAILNIITDTDTSLYGIMGSVSVSSDNINPIPNPNLWLQAQIGKFTFSASGGFWNINDKENFSKNDLEADYADSGNHLKTQSEQKGTTNGGWWGAEASLELDSLNLFTAEFNGYSHAGDNNSAGSHLMSDRSGRPVYSYLYNEKSPDLGYLDLDANFNYQHSTTLKGETITASYQISTTDQHNKSNTVYSEMYGMPVPYSGINSDSHLKFMEHTFQIDWARPLTERQKIDIGAKYILRNNHTRSTREYTGVSTTDDDFTHRTHIASVYGDYRIRFGKFNARAGLRYEFSRLSAMFIKGDSEDFSSDLNDFVPNASFSWNASETSTFKLTYNRRIQRPGIQYLNPTVNYSPTSVSSGNPRLESMTFDALLLNYSLILPKFNLDATVSFRTCDNGVASVMNVENDVTYTTYHNIAHARQIHFNTYFQWSISEKTKVNCNLNVSWSKHTYPQENNLSLSRWMYNPYIRISQNLPWKIELSMNAGFWSGYMQSVYCYNKMDMNSIWYSLSLRRSFLKDDRLTVLIRASNPFGSDKRTGKTCYVNSEYTGTDTYMMKNMTKFGLRLTYRFGSMNASVKKTAVSINNDDLDGRKM